MYLFFSYLIVSSLIILATADFKQEWIPSELMFKGINKPRPNFWIAFLWPIFLIGLVIIILISATETAMKRHSPRKED